MTEKKLKQVFKINLEIKIYENYVKLFIQNL